MTEIWKDIKEYEGRYQVSNLGRVKRLPYGKGINSKEKIKSINRVTKDGYIMITLPGGERPLHRLVAETFIPNVDNKDTVNHIDGNKKNNRVDNLEWATRHEQLIHAYKLGLKKPLKGCDNPNSKLSAEQVDYIRRTYKPHSKTCGAQILAKQFNVTVHTILNIAKYRNYQ